MIQLTPARRQVPRFVAWEGRSPLTGDPIVLILTARSLNAKTGPMWQAWLLHQTLAPFDAVREGADAAICGGCARRGGPAGSGRSCYVNLFTGPSGIYRAYKAGSYPRLTPVAAADQLAGQHVRVTAYGDPVVLPWAFWSALLARTAGWVGYTHLWRLCDQRYRALLMASCDTPEEAATAAAMGWRTFRVRAAGDPVQPWEFICPASDEGQHRATCQRCQLCRGTASPAKSVVIISHGRQTAQGRRGQYDHIRAELELGSTIELDRTERDVARILLAIRQSYRRRGEDRRLRTRRQGDGRTHVWLDDASRSEA